MFLCGKKFLGRAVSQCDTHLFHIFPFSLFHFSSLGRALCHSVTQPVILLRVLRAFVVKKISWTRPVSQCDTHLFHIFTFSLFPFPVSGTRLCHSVTHNFFTFSLFPFSTFRSQGRASIVDLKHCYRNCSISSFVINSTISENYQW